MLSDRQNGSFSLYREANHEPGPSQLLGMTSMLGKTSPSVDVISKGCEGQGSRLIKRHTEASVMQYAYS